MKTTIRWGWPLVAGLLLTLSGCGGSGLVDVNGRLTYKGQPVPSTIVIFAPEGDGQRPSRGLTDDDGNFKLSYSKGQSGAQRGKHTVVLKYFVSGPEELHEIPPKASAQLRKVIAQFGDQTSSPLHYDVSKNGQFVEIELAQ